MLLLNIISGCQNHLFSVAHEFLHVTNGSTTKRVVVRVDNDAFLTYILGSVKHFRDTLDVNMVSFVRGQSDYNGRTVGVTR
jgi:hypothetical protein